MIVSAERVEEMFHEYANIQKSNVRSWITECPLCLNAKKFYIFKHNGKATCHRPSCEFGKRSFHEWLALVIGIDAEEAKKMILRPVIIENTSKIKLDIFDFDQMDEKDDFSDLPSMEYPQLFHLDLDDPQSEEGVKYLQSRGVSKEVAEYYEITYNPLQRRVVLPIYQYGKCRGWQARAIDKVGADFRMRNNDGFRRDSLVMFFDSAKDEDDLFILEGPFDALKFHGHGGFIATMGKVITPKQVSLIRNTSSKRVFIGLDDDAAPEINKLRTELDGIKNLYWIKPPQSCIDRCTLQGKKADFGECTPEEIKEAILSAKSLLGGVRQMIIHFK